MSTVGHRNTQQSTKKYTTVPSHCDRQFASQALRYILLPPERKSPEIKIIKVSLEQRTSKNLLIELLVIIRFMKNAHFYSNFLRLLKPA